MENLTTLDRCLACDSKHLELALDLGHQPLANSYQTEIDENESFWPLAVNRCTKCNHLQLTHIVAPELIYKDYAYVSGTSQTYVDYMKWYAKWTREYVDQWHGAVLDIGCNDGTQLNYFKKLGVKTYGIDPAENLLQFSGQNHTIVCDFFNAQTAAEFAKLHGNVDCVVAQNSFAHNPNPLEYLRSLKQLINPNGLFFIQTSQANMVLNKEFDTIYHEHVNFYNINSMRALCEAAGFNLVDVQKTPIHGTSYVFVLSPSRKMPERINNLIALEKQAGLLTKSTYVNWANTVKNNVSQLSSYGFLFRNREFKLVGYGAAAKGNTLLNFSHLPLDFIIDDNALKQGTYSPGKRIPVVSIDELKKIPSTTPVLFVPLAWNFYDEIRRRILAVRSNTEDRFMRYFPEVVVE
jgi:2-polyprenyl-3-methyl-5-hydroxy-6-metoxy-1,4-benzoquinol methylase